MDSIHKDIIDLVFNDKKNVFISGEAGTGKSYTSKLLKDYANSLDTIMHLTSTTGITAINIGGTTIHRWSGIKIGKESATTIVQTIRLKNKDCLNRWKSTDVLLIDEISLLGKKNFELIDKVGRMVRGVNKPFGGIRLIVTGDFLQLPPVNDDYCFQSLVWDLCNFSYIRLTTPKRYNDLQHFYLLQRLRCGLHTKEDINILRSRLDAYYDYMRAGGDDNKDLLIKPTKITPLKLEVEKINKNELDKISGKYYQYNSIDSFSIEKDEDNDDNKNDDISDSENLENNKKDYKDFLNTIVDDKLYFKPNAQVMLTYNLDIENGLCNGSRGIIISCDEYGVIVKFKSHEEPIRISPIDFEIKEGKVKMIRNQIPLIIAYAITIHKSQGSSLDCAILNIGYSIFGPNMSYVAIGRVRNIEGIYLSTFSPQKIIACPIALEFEEKIKNNCINKI